MSTSVTLKLPDAWITENGTLFMVAYAFFPITRAFEAGNKALEESGYDERILWTKTDPLSERPSLNNRWVDPAYVAAEQWPNSAVSKQPKVGWVKLHRIDVGDLTTPPAGLDTPEGQATT